MKYYLIATNEVVVGHSDHGNSDIVETQEVIREELTQEDIDTITHDNYYSNSISKFRKVFE